MNFDKLKKDYSHSKLNKEEYIKEMHDMHQILFEYSQFLMDTDIKKITITDKNVIMTSRESEIKILCDPDDQRIIPIEILNFGAYEKEEMDMILNLIEKNSYFYDIGANIGWYSINIAKKMKNVKVFAFEPIPKTFGYLEKNTALNDIKNINLFNFGFSDEENEFIFYYYPEGSGNASLVNLSGLDEVEEVLCKVKKLDNFVENGPVDFIKCDVEGAELFVLKGGLETIKKFKPIIFVELLRKWAAKFGYHPQDVVLLLRNLGYSCYIINREKLVEISQIDEQTVQTNFLFLNQKDHKDIIQNLVLHG
jgi:FkbM family methyltransferase